LAVTGCGGAATSTPSPTPDDSVFLSSWHSRWANASDAAALRVAHGICDAYKAGTTFAGEVQYLITTGPAGMTGGDAGFMIGAATSSYCPEYNSRH
jgi:hypothetical protein